MTCVDEGIAVATGRGVGDEAGVRAVCCASPPSGSTPCWREPVSADADGDASGVTATEVAVAAAGGGAPGTAAGWATVVGNGAGAGGGAGV